MRCDDCRHQVSEGPSQDCPYPNVWCSKGHWEGIDHNGIECTDPWIGCLDFKELNVSEEKFSKGDWFIDKSYATWLDICANDVHVCEVDSRSVAGEIVPTGEQLANAHLIAAAPEMYRMVESLKSELYQMIDELNDQRLNTVHSQTETPPDLIDMESISLADKLLAKARGER